MEKTCTQAKAIYGGTITLNDFDSTHCERFSFVASSFGDAPVLSVPSTLIQVGNVSDHSHSYVAITLLPYIYLPTEKFNRLNEAYKAEEMGGMYIVGCDATPGPLMMLIGDVKLQWNYTDLVERIDGKRCFFRIRPYNGTELKHTEYTGEIILGLPFLQRYCIAMDNAESRIGFALKKGYNPRVCTFHGFLPKHVPTPIAPVTTGLSPGILVLLVVAIVAVSILFIIVVGVVCWLRRRRTKLRRT
ncbi:aspartyl protease 6, partial [Aphelenchoides avenae]